MGGGELMRGLLIMLALLAMAGAGFWLLVPVR